MKKFLLLLLVSSASMISTAQPLSNSTWACYDLSNVFFRYYSFGTDTLYFGTTLPSLTAYSLFSNNFDSVSMLDFSGPCVSTTGQYTYTIQNDTLLLTPVNDPCGIRLNVLSTYHFVGVITGTVGLNGAPPIDIYPNPSTDGVFNLQYENPIDDMTMVTVTNNLGVNVFGTQLRGQVIRQSIDLHILPPGIYIVSLQNKKMKKTFRVVQ